MVIGPGAQTDPSGGCRAGEGLGWCLGLTGRLVFPLLGRIFKQQCRLSVYWMTISGAVVDALTTTSSAQPVKPSFSANTSYVPGTTSSNV